MKSHSMNRRGFLKVAGAGGAALATGLGGPAAPFAQTAKQIKFTLPWLAEGSNLIAFVAKSKGFWAKHGLDVTVSRGFGSIAAAQAVGAGQFEYGLASASAGILQSVKGLPIMQIACLGYNATMGIGVLGDSPIKTPKDLEGKKVASVIQSGEYPFLPAYAEKAGFDLSKVTQVAVDNKVRERLLMEKEVDAISGYAISAIPVIAAQGVKVRFMQYADVGLKVYNNTVMTTPTRFAAERGMSEAIVQGLIEATQLTLLDPEQALALFYKEVPEAALVAATKEQVRIGLGIFGVSILEETARVKGLGYAEPADFETMTDLTMKYLAKEGDKRPAVAEMLNNDFVGKVKLSDSDWQKALSNAKEFKSFLA